MKKLIILLIFLLSCSNKNIKSIKPYNDEDSIQINNYEKVNIIKIIKPEYQIPLENLIRKNRLCKNYYWVATFKNNKSEKFIHISQFKIESLENLVDLNFSKITFYNNIPILISIEDNNNKIFSYTGHYIYWKKTKELLLGFDDTSPEWIIYNGKIKKIRNGICK